MEHIKKVRPGQNANKDKKWKDWPPEVFPPEPEKVPPDLPQEVAEQSDGNDEPI